MDVMIPKEIRSTASHFSRSVRSAASGKAPLRDTARSRAHLVSAFQSALDEDGRRPPWPHQADSVRAIAGHFAQGAVNAISVIPTAGGKSEIFQRLVAASYRNAEELDLRTVILVPTRQLVLQTLKSFAEQFPNMRVGFLGKGLGTRWAPTMIMTYARFVSMVQRGRIVPGDIDHLVMDEAHRGLSDLRQGYFRQFLGSLLVTAFSATPVYDINKNIYRLLGSSNEVMHIKVAELIATRRIAPVVNVVVGVNLIGAMLDNQAAMARVLKAASVRAMLDLRASQTFSAFPEIGISLADRSFVAYTWGVEHAQDASSAFATAHPDEDFRSISYLTDTAEQQASIQGLTDRKLSGIFNAMALLEGTDIPTLGAVFNLAPTTSLVRQMQRCGRALRLDPSLDSGDQKQTAVVVDFFYRINGKMIGRPVFYYDAIGDSTIAVAINTAPVDFTPLLGRASIEDVASHGADKDAEAARIKALVSGDLEDADAEDDDDDAAFGDADHIRHESDMGEARQASEAQAGTVEFTGVESHGAISRVDILERLQQITVLTEVANIVAIANERDSVRFGTAEKGLIGRTDIAMRLGVATDTPLVRDLFNGIEEEVLPRFAVDNNAWITVTRNGIDIDVCYRRVGFVCWPQYRLDQIGRFAALCDATEIDKGDTWIGLTQVCSTRGTGGPWTQMLLGMIEEFSAKRRAMKLASEPVKRRLDAWARFDIRPSAAPDAMPVRMELCRNGATRVVCFHKDDVPLIRQMVGLVKTNVPRHSEEWLGFGEICEILGAKSNQIRAAMQAIAELYDAARGDSFDEREVTYGGRTLRVCRVTRHSARTFFCVHKDCLDDLVAASGAKIAPPVEKEWMPRNTVAAICGCDQRSRGFARLWSTLADAHEKGEPTILEGRAFKMENRRVGKVVLPCLARKHVEAFRAVFVSADPHMHPSSGGNEPDDDSETFTFQP